MKKELIAILYTLAAEIRDLKEKECGNSGLNWYDRFERAMRSLESLEDSNVLPQ